MLAACHGCCSGCFGGRSEERQLQAPTLGGCERQEGRIFSRYRTLDPQQINRSEVVLVPAFLSERGRLVVAERYSCE